MKIKLDLDYKDGIKITSDDDNKHFYLIVFNENMDKYSLWHDGKIFSFENNLIDIPSAIGHTVTALLYAYKHNQEKDNNHVSI